MVVELIRQLNRQRLQVRHQRREWVSHADAVAHFFAQHPDLPLGPQPGRDLNFAHSGNAGDVIYALPTALAMAAGRPSALYLKIGAPSEAPSDHPVGNVRLNERMVEALAPLLAAQPAFREVRLHAGEPIDVELDVFREAPVRTDRGNIARWYCAIWAVSFDLSRPWLQAEPQPGLEDTVVIARSSRYRNGLLDYRFLRKLPRLAFVGIEPEFKDMRRLLPKMEFIRTDDYLQLARVIRGCRLFIGNQSSPFAVAEGLKVPRILEVFDIAPNVIPEGIGGYEAWFQPQFEHLVQHCLST